MTPYHPDRRGFLALGAAFDGMDEEVAKSVDAAIELLNKRVASVEDIVMPATPLSFDDIYARVRSIEAYAYHSQWIGESPEKYQAVTRQRILQNSAKVTSAGYVEARLQVDRLRREIKKSFAKVDLLVTPTMLDVPRRRQRSTADAGRALTREGGPRIYSRAECGLAAASNSARTAAMNSCRA